MAVSDYSTTPASNVTISGINIAEGCAAGNINGAFRQLMADIRVMYNSQPVLTDYVKKDGTVSMTAALIRSGSGAHLWHNNSSNTSGRVFVQATGGTIPSMSNGDILIEY